VHLLKAFSPISVTLFGTAILVRLVQLLKALAPMLVTLFGMVTLLRLVQFIKAQYSILVTLFGMVTLVSSVLQLLKASLGMVVKALPEILRFTYLPAELIASVIFGSVDALALIVIFIGSSELLAGCLSRYSFNSSAVLKLFPPLLVLLLLTLLLLLLLSLLLLPALLLSALPLLLQEGSKRANKSNNNKNFSLEKIGAGSESFLLMVFVPYNLQDY
jgi:hypothetical protein